MIGAFSMRREREKNQDWWDIVTVIEQVIDSFALAEKELLQEGHSRSSGLELTPWFCFMPLQ